MFKVKLSNSTEILILNYLTWVLGFGFWALGTGPKPQSPNPQSPILSKSMINLKFVPYG